ncbi:MAG TPA: DUF72 domain-containing protein [Candidatus Aminicenantes bacterium]|nr:DUF72 domain-containing protein [Candidatus Aminicenantes bacterium]
MPDPRILFRLGTAGWSYADWQGTVYPHPQPPGFSALRFLAEIFDFVEINTTFYRIPSPRLTQGWVQQIRDVSAFQFWVKLNRAFTHENSSDELQSKAFTAAIQPLREAGKLAGILAQYPYSFHCTDANLDRVDRLRDFFRDIPIAVEFRHRTWNRDSTLAFLRNRRLCWTNIDQPRLSRSLPLTSLSTGSGVEYLRLHGRNAAEWFSGSGRDARYDYDYSAAELREIACAAVRTHSRSGSPVFISGNNHYKGQAVRNLKTLKQILEAMMPQIKLES